MPEKPAFSAPTVGSWAAAARLVTRWLEHRDRVDELFATLPPTLTGAERARCQHLVFGVVRHFGRIDAELGRRMARPPRAATRAVLLIAGFELVEALADSPVADGLVAKIVHHAVEQAKHLASPAEAKLVNAVVRRLAEALAKGPPPALAEAAVLAEYFSHPEWLVRRWLVQLGADPTRRLLEWNQQPAVVHARWRDSAMPAPAWLKPTAWPGFLEVPSGRWPEVEPLLAAGRLYLQDPGTRLAVELLAPQAGETLLDVCAAPGGKSLLIADALRAAAPAKSGSAGRVVAVDLPGPRIERLKQNLARAEGVDVALVQGDLLAGEYRLFDDHRLPTEYAGVLLDAPCSNSGVMRHRVDVKWRLQERDFAKHARQQVALLHAAARLVAPGGRLVYSTCSIDAEENAQVVKTFFESRAGSPFKLERSLLSYPWESGHDGAAAFLLRKA
ncbi:MAG TPA: RsmB/NOP family class I SAM-dependent RNA methyltransferase [Opitutaceae bacterium]|nr:RsmB/NOP family class I SAM-dependent RNA methyltransferase [Opitutaceae bacterium]